MRKTELHHRLLHSTASIVSAFAFTACGLPADNESSTLTAPTRAASSIILASEASSHDGERHLRALARTAPHATAFFFDGADALVVELLPTAGVEELDSAQGWLVEQARLNGMMEIDRAKVKLAVRRTGKGPSLAQLLKWRDDILATVSTFPAFSSLDLDEQSGKIVIGLEKLDEADSLRGILSGAKIPADVLLIEQSSMALTYPIPGSVFSRSRPLAGGVIIGSSECTLGIAALAESGAYSFLMTAGHCSPTFGVPDAYWMRQPLSGMQLLLGPQFS